MTILTRPARPADIPAITAIHRHWVLHGTGNFAETPNSEADMLALLAQIHQLSLPFIVAYGKDDPDTVLGYAYAGLFRPRNAYRFYVEDSVYVSPSAQSRGIGKILLGQLIEDATRAGKRQMIAVIGDSDNHGSINLHKAHGFIETGLLKSAGFKFGQWRDVVLMQRALGSGDSSQPEDL